MSSPFIAKHVTTTKPNTKEIFHQGNAEATFVQDEIAEIPCHGQYERERDIM